MQEFDIQNQIRIALSKSGLPFRTNSGEFYQGERIYSVQFKQDVLINLRRVSGLPKGFTDLLYIGEDNIAFIECKTHTGRVSPEQLKFIKLMRKLHHYAGIARSAEDAIEIINGGLLL